jgi:hypothetical protein
VVDSLPNAEAATPGEGLVRHQAALDQAKNEEI